jgi:hypothetical protein
MLEGSMPRRTAQRGAPVVHPWTIVIAVAVVTFVALLMGGYGLNWTWTGFSSNDHLWDWLQLLVYPVVLGALSIWLSTRHRWTVQWGALLIALLVAFIIVVIGGYALDWTWTGFQGNSLWDWWKLLLIPFVLPAVLAWISAHPDATSATPQHHQTDDQQHVKSSDSRQGPTTAAG